MQFINILFVYWSIQLFYFACATIYQLKYPQYYPTHRLFQIRLRSSINAFTCFSLMCGITMILMALGYDDIETAHPILSSLSANSSTGIWV